MSRTIYFVAVIADGKALIQSICKVGGNCIRCVHIDFRQFEIFLVIQIRIVVMVLESLFVFLSRITIGMNEGIGICFILLDVGFIRNFS